MSAREKAAQYWLPRGALDADVHRALTEAFSLGWDMAKADTPSREAVADVIEKGASRAFLNGTRGQRELALGSASAVLALLQGGE